ncbi:tigger transposable element-derived protein 4-like [Metopolophium dirhodum]|uniref:tigger transposable element-derived protein 4-like n=1 Tax=Metopolophium dirhodum TaxID=44670 RepID=UPI00298F8E60|nr:tigger transposable element-derived protein 4-like [Metopolophium dirhodum]
MSNKRRRCFTIVEKVKIIERLESGVSNKDICQELGISQSTLSIIWKSKYQIKSVFQTLIKDYNVANIKTSIRLSWNEKATEFGKRFNKFDFQCSSSWITRFRQRHNIVFGKISGESSSVPVGVSENWLEHVWPNLRKNYTDCDIYNADETGLFYRLTPSQTLRFKGETCSDVIGKSKTPRCFKNVKNLTVDYKSNKKAWMTGDIFSGWLKEWDKQLAKEKRHILLTIDNCPAHPPVQFEFIKLVLLPPNTTSVLQPMDQVLDAILMISDAWNDFSTTTIRNCFHHAGFKASVNDKTEIVIENNLDTECFSEESIQSFAEVDDALLTNKEPNKEEIVKSILNANNDESNEQADEESEEIVFKVPSISEMYFYIDQNLTNISQHSNEVPIEDYIEDNDEDQGSQDAIEQLDRITQSASTEKAYDQFGKHVAY